MNAPDIRVEKGHAEPEEVAAITAILLARAAAHSAAPTATHRGRVKAGWRRLERENGFRAPHSWR
ncbi:MAG: acyl-CoA carboxylase subunit epsilon [Streptomyces sp.]|uniref:acyl-CoA carboxylase subunit epsilon n=1 Tax=Streptomyces sp. B93 TaxID=2824875 RepID=UPI001983B409|nr:acyl-CoA carboxylase subunit epsilon [Streptomyces sp. B93]MBC7271286.1 acyl-CoA carboxylase subunit epsilon [Streptomyces sp.]MBQ1092319.1 acyl-CoA carboxylase subunit epsilon [Streptomyces sp. B93]